MTRPRLFIAVLTACLAVSPAFLSPAQADDASHRKAAEALIAAEELDKTYEKTIDTALSQMTMSPQMAQYKDIMHAFLDKYMGWDTVKEEVLKAYIADFTEDELKQITAFYETPVGKKTTEKLPELEMQISQAAQQRMQAHLPELQQEIMDAAKKNAAPAPAKP
jgi:uncharacterized protein